MSIANASAILPFRASTTFWTLLTLDLTVGITAPAIIRIRTMTYKGISVSEINGSRIQLKKGSDFQKSCAHHSAPVRNVKRWDT
uniref:Uncharacterized protein n=1 Tax=Arundo donax TaxID=35708 RepID=A0A0A9F6U2_ARUDO